MVEQRTQIRNVITFRNSQGEQARGTLMKLTRSMLVMEVYNPYSIVQLSEVLGDLAIYRGDRPIYRGRAVVSNLVNTGLMLIASVKLVDPWLDLSELIGCVGGIREETERFVEDWRASQQLRPGYQLIVSELRSFYYELSRWLEQVDVNMEQEAAKSQQLDEEQFQEFLRPIIPQATELFQRFEEEAAQVSEDEVNNHKAFVQRDLHPLIMRAPFPYRAFYKPLGYAGDYEMVNMMLRDPREGPTTYAELVNTLILLAGPPQAHRNRIVILENWLLEAAARFSQKGRPLKVLNVGCGPAIELQRFIYDDELAARCHFRLVDFSEETLQYTQEQISKSIAESHNDPRIELVHMSVHSLLKSAVNKSAGVITDQYDVIYCAGLFDYLSDRVCERLLRLFYRWVNPEGGKILATNVHPDNNARFQMEHILEWHLVYRDEAAMGTLLRGVGKQRTFVDETGINVFLEIERQDDPDAAGTGAIASRRPISSRMRVH